MLTARAALKVIVICSVSVATASGVNVPCGAGTRVYSLAVWSGYWLDGLVMRCTGDSDEQTIPPEFNEQPGGEEAEDICAGTEGVHSIEWGVPDAYSGMVYLNITCLDNETHHFANGLSYDSWNITSSRNVSCEEEQYVQGITYSPNYLENSSVAYILSSVDFMCSSSTLDPICTDCSADTTLKSDGNQPKFCELPSCSDTECCDPKADEDSESITVSVVLGVVSSVVAAMIISGSAWMLKKFKHKTDTTAGVEVFPVEGGEGTN